MYQITFATLFVAQYNGTIVRMMLSDLSNILYFPAVLSDRYKIDTAVHFKRSSAKQELKELNSFSCFFFLLIKKLESYIYYFETELVLEYDLCYTVTFARNSALKD